MWKNSLSFRNIRNILRYLPERTTWSAWEPNLPIKQIMWVGEAEYANKYANKYANANMMGQRWRTFTAQPHVRDHFVVPALIPVEQHGMVASAKHTAAWQ